MRRKPHVVFAPALHGLLVNLNQMIAAMPLYELFCADCNTVSNFFSSRPNTDKRPDCPKCGRKELQKMVSTFATIGKAKEGEGDDPLAGLDEAKMERAMAGLMREAEHVNEDDPRQMARLMRTFMDKTGLFLGGQMEEAIARMESGDDPEKDADLSVRTMFLMAVATSIDALAVGISLAMVGSVNIWLAAAFIGICTCLLSALGVKIGNVFGSRYEKKAEFAGGVILILLGVKILLEHLGVLA